MKMHRLCPAPVLAGAILASACAGCTPVFEYAAQPAPARAGQDTGTAGAPAGDGVRALTLRVNWNKMEPAQQVQGF